MQLQFSNKLNAIYQDLVCLLLFSLPLSRKLIVVVLILALISNVLRKDFVIEFKNTIKSVPKLILIFIYVLGLIGISYSANIDSALFDAQVKLSFLMIPVFLTSSSFDVKGVDKLKASFVYGNLVALLICVGNASYHYYISHQTYFFYYTFFSVFVHSSYFSMYLTMAIAFILFNKTLRKSFLGIIQIILMSGGIFLCSSRSGLIIFILMLMIFLAHLYINEKNKKGLFLPLILFLIFGIAAYSLPGLNSRIKEAINGTVASASLNSGESTYSLRTNIWKNSFGIIKENLLFGVGPGDVKEELSNVYIKSNLVSASDFHLNAHNQFIQIQLASGLLGLTALLLLLIILFKNAIQNKDFIALTFVVITSVSFLFESMLETQAGVVFFALFIVIFYSASKAKEVKT